MESKPKKTFFYSFARVVMWLLMPLIFPAVFVDRKKLHVDAPYLMVCNHKSLMDAILLAMRSPYEIHFLGKEEVRRNPVLRWLVDRLHMIPVSRGQNDLAAMRACLNALKAGQVVGVFPEGTRRRGGDMQEVLSGVGLLALKSGVPVVPLCIEKKPRLFRLTKVYVGDPIPYEDLRLMGTNKEAADLMMARIREHILALPQTVEKLPDVRKNLPEKGGNT